jgi:hemerythrin-like domain-containing protein
MPATTKATTKRTASASRTAKKASSAEKGGASRKSSPSRRRTEPDAIDLLKQDHDEVEQLFSRFEGLGNGARKRRQQLVDKIIESLSMHAAIEEQVLYPAARREVPSTDDDVLESLEEHHIVKWTLSELEDLDPDDERFVAKVTVLMESVRHHVDEEEQELFPQLRKALGASRLRELGAELAAAKRTAPKRPHPRSPDTPPGNIIAQAVTAPFDAVAGLTSATAERVRDIVT